MLIDVASVRSKLGLRNRCVHSARGQVRDRRTDGKLNAASAGSVLLHVLQTIFYAWIELCNHNHKYR